LGLNRISRRGAALIAGCALALPVAAGTAAAAHDLRTSGASQSNPSGHVSGDVSPGGGSINGSGRGGGESVSGSGKGSQQGVSGKASGGAGGGSMKAGREGGSGEVCGPDGSCRGGSVPPSDPPPSPDAKAGTSDDGAAHAKGKVTPSGGSASGSGSFAGEGASGSGKGSEQGVSGKADSRAGGGSMKAGREGGSGEVCGPDGSCRGGSVPPSDVDCRYRVT
jgi:hypothetical protein